MSPVIDEGRSALRGLRSQNDLSLDLEQAFSRIHEEFAFSDKVSFRVIVNGQPRSLHPLLRDELYRIGREALVNAFRHSGATHVSVTIEPVSKSSGSGLHGGAARVRVQDNGEGLPPDHKFGLGLTGMRERVMALGGTMTVASTQDGLTVEAVVPRGAHS